jgi:NitT/TauT family transport system substrate-binding protein
VRAFVKTHKAMHDPKLGAEARDKVHAKYFESVDKAVFDEAWQRMLPGVATTVAVSRGQMDRVVSFLNEFSSEKVTADVEKAYTNRFVEAASS